MVKVSIEDRRKERRPVAVAGIIGPIAASGGGEGRSCCGYGRRGQGRTRGGATDNGCSVPVAANGPMMALLPPIPFPIRTLLFITALSKHDRWRVQRTYACVCGVPPLLRGGRGEVRGGGGDSVSKRRRSSSACSQRRCTPCEPITYRRRSAADAESLRCRSPLVFGGNSTTTSQWRRQRRRGIPPPPPAEQRASLGKGCGCGKRLWGRGKTMMVVPPMLRRLVRVI